jgi:hypothetical protein
MRPNGLRARAPLRVGGLCLLSGPADCGAASGRAGGRGASRSECALICSGPTTLWLSDLDGAGEEVPLSARDTRRRCGRSGACRSSATRRSQTARTFSRVIARSDTVMPRPYPRRGRRLRARQRRPPPWRAGKTPAGAPDLRQALPTGRRAREIVAAETCLMAGATSLRSLSLGETASKRIRSVADPPWSVLGSPQHAAASAARDATRGSLERRTRGARASVRCCVPMHGQRTASEFRPQQARSGPVLGRSHLGVSGRAERDAVSSPVLVDAGRTSALLLAKCRSPGSLPARPA